MINLDAARGPVDRVELHKLLDRLLDLRERTDPAICSDPSVVLGIDPPPKTVVLDGQEVEVLEVRRGKNEVARWATFVAEQLIVSVAGWAINHKVGCALADPQQDLDSHDHERIGEQAAAPGGGRLDEPSKARTALLAALQSRTLPFDVAFHLKEALAALEMGEVMPLVERVPTGQHGQAYTQTFARMEAVAYVNFQHGKGMSKTKVETNVAKALGVDESTLKTWASRDLPRALGIKTVKKNIAEARRAGRLFEEVRHDKARRQDCLRFTGSDEWLLLTAAFDWEGFDLSRLKSKLTEPACKPQRRK
jgi:hypothetical protein